jgi:hypothetical protein
MPYLPRWLQASASLVGIMTSRAPLSVLALVHTMQAAVTYAWWRAYQVSGSTLSALESPADTMLYGPSVVTITLNVQGTHWRNNQRLRTVHADDVLIVPVAFWRRFLGWLLLWRSPCYQLKVVARSGTTELMLNGQLVQLVASPR